MISSKNMPPDEAADRLARAVRALIEARSKGVLASLLPARRGALCIARQCGVSDGGNPSCFFRGLPGTLRTSLPIIVPAFFISDDAEGKDPLEGPRVSLIGRICAHRTKAGRKRVISAIHPNARSYARFRRFQLLRAQCRNSPLCCWFWPNRHHRNVPVVSSQAA